MTKSEIISSLEKQGIKFNPKALRSELEDLLKSRSFEVASIYVGKTLYTNFGKFRLTNSLSQEKLGLLYEKGFTEQVIKKQVIKKQ